VQNVWAQQTNLHSSQPWYIYCEQKNSSYGRTYLGSNVSIFSSKIFENVAEVNADTFKSIFESRSFQNQKFLHQTFQLKNIDTFEKDDSDVISVSSGLLSTHEVDSSVVNGSLNIFYLISLFTLCLF